MGAPLVVWFKRGLLGLVAGVVLVLGLALTAFYLEKAEKAELLTNQSRIASTPLGDIEFSTAGEGIPMLMFHGTPGGYDQMLGIAYEGVMTISVSRPGYLRTPLASGFGRQRYRVTRRLEIRKGSGSK